VILHPQLYIMIAASFNTKLANVAPARSVVARAGKYDEELIKTANAIASRGKGIMAMDESNGTCGKRLDSIGVENTEANRLGYRELLVTTPGLGEYISGAILFEETLYQTCSTGKTMVEELAANGIITGIKVDKGLVPMFGTNDELWCQGLDGLSERCAEYYKQGARFAKWRSVVSVAAGPSMIAQRDCAYGLARYAKICQENGLVPIVEPEVLLDGEHTIDQTLKAAEDIWAETFKYMADNGVMFEAILLKPAMVTAGAECKEQASPEKVSDYTLKMLNRRVPPAVPGIMFLSGGQSEMDATLNLNAMNQTPNPWHVSFSYARALQNSVLKAWAGQDDQIKAGQEALLRRAAANSAAQKGEYSAEGEDASAGERMYEKGYQY